MELEYSSEDKSMNFKFEYIRKGTFKNYPAVGKTYPMQTQCILYYNGFVRAIGTVVKHHADKDNPRYAYIAATKKVMEEVYFTSMRKEIWELLFAKLDKLQADEIF